MALTQDEARIRIGVDTTQVQAGMQRASDYVNHFGDKMITKMNKLLAVNVWHEAIQLASEGIKKLTEMWIDFHYKIDAKEFARIEQQQKHFAALRAELSKTSAEYDKIAASDYFKRSTELGKQLILEEELAKNADAQMQADIERRTARDELAKAGDKSGEEHQRQISILAESETKLNRLGEERIKLEERLDAVREKIDDAAKKANEEEIKGIRAARDAAIEAYSKREKAATDLQAAEFQGAIRATSARRAEMEKFMPSLGELAQSGGPFARAAQSIEWLGQKAKMQFIQGNDIWAGQTITERNRRYDELAKRGIVPERQEKAAEAQIQTADILQQIKDGTITLQTALQLVKD